jgi:hypothetical protein
MFYSRKTTFCQHNAFNELRLRIGLKPQMEKGSFILSSKVPYEAQPLMLLPAGPAHCPYFRGSVLTSVGLAGQFLRGVIGRSTTQRGCSDRFRGQIRGVTDRSSPKRLVRLDDTRLLPYRFLDTTVQATGATGDRIPARPPDWMRIHALLPGLLESHAKRIWRWGM